MQRARVRDDLEIEYEVVGRGEPVVFIHGAFIADAFRPLLAESVLASRHTLLVYRRRGYGGNASPSAQVSVAQHAADCVALLRALGVDRAHVVGHSYGGCVALQLALDAPNVAHSLALLEPGLAVGASGPEYLRALSDGASRYRAVGAEQVVDEFLEARWPAYRERLEQVLPGASAQAAADAATWFNHEMPGQLEWRFQEDEARRIGQPTLSVVGGASEQLWPRFGETHRALLDWLPRGEGFVLPDATHFLQLESPRHSRILASALAGFFARYPMETVEE